MLADLAGELGACRRPHPRRSRCVRAGAVEAVEPAAIKLSLPRTDQVQPGGLEAVRVKEADKALVAVPNPVLELLGGG